MMKEEINQRLGELQAEYQKGQERLAYLEQELSNVKSSMLRISGAIQVLEELLEEHSTSPTDPSSSDQLLPTSEKTEADF